MGLKAFSEAGLNALCSFIKQTRATSNSNTTSLSGLGESISELASKTTATLEEVDAALVELEGSKQDKSDFQTVAISASGWAANTDSDSKAAGYAYAYSAALSSASAADSAESVLSVSSIKAAADCGLCATADVLDGAIRYYAITAPTEEITLQVHLIKG